MMQQPLVQPFSSEHSANTVEDMDAVVIDGRTLTIEEFIRVARHKAPVKLTTDPEVQRLIHASCQYIEDAVAEGQPIYGVTTGFGGMADLAINKEDAAELQNNLIWYHKTAAGKRLPEADVRGALLLRVNSHARGVSGLRLEIIERMIIFLNANVIPHVHELGSIGASGDLVPLTYICGSLIGLDNCFKVDFDGETMGAVDALERLGLEPLRLLPKEGLAMINGTSVMTAIAANAIYDANQLLQVTMGAHALMLQGLRGTNQSFHPFIHHQKPHAGQIWAAQKMLDLLQGSQLSRNELNGDHDYREDDLIQDRYSLRCLPQYMGPIVDGLAQITRQIEVEMNSASDNPLIDSVNGASYHGGNFLGEYVGVGMDQLRYYMGLLAKHLDVQISLLMSPHFSNGLPPSLRGNQKRQVNMGLKGLQIAGNSIMPLISFYGNSLADRFPTHAEQFNQNINSQGFGSANLARQSLQLYQQYMGIALIMAVQAVDLRTFSTDGHYDARATLSPATVRLYEAVWEVTGKTPSDDKAFVWDDDERPLDFDMAAITYDLTHEGKIIDALKAQ